MEFNELLQQSRFARIRRMPELQELIAESKRKNEAEFKKFLQLSRFEKIRRRPEWQELFESLRNG